MTSALLQFAPDLPGCHEAFNIRPEDLATLGKSTEAVFVKALDQYIGLVSGECSQADAMVSSALRDHCWEELNTGHWAQVPLIWRTVYAHAALFSAAAHLNSYLVSCRTNVQALRDALHNCDLGLIMGKPTEAAVVTGLATRCHEELVRCCDTASAHLKHTPSVESRPLEHGEHCVEKQLGRRADIEAVDVDAAECEPTRKLRDVPTITSPLRRLRCPSLETFSRELLGRQPAVLTGCVSHWRALGWTVPQLVRTAGHRTVPVELGGRYTDAGWSQRLMTLGEFVARHVTLTPPQQQPGYLAQHELLEQIPELAADVAVPDYCLLGECADVHANVWFGPAGTVSPLHHDPKHNCLVQVFGHKYVRVLAPEQTTRLYPHQTPMLDNTSRVDAERPDLDEFPLFAEARYHETLLAPGDMLYMPPGWWHYVRSLSVSCSVSFWFK